MVFQVARFLKLANISSIEDVISTLPKFMCHISQEPDVFGTYRRRKNVPLIKANKKKFEKDVEKISPLDYINFFLNKDGLSSHLISSDLRVACTCKQMAEVSALLVSTLLKKDVYIIGCCIPRYVRGRHSKFVRDHYFNAIIENNVVRYFDSSVYKNIFDFSINDWVPVDKTTFDLSNVNFDRDIYWDSFLQSSSNKVGSKCRSIYTHQEKEIVLVDNFASKKLSNNNYYFKVESYNSLSKIYYVDDGVLVIKNFIDL